MRMKPAISYFPALLCTEHDSPLDALLSLCVSQAEAMNLVAAACLAGDFSCLLTSIDGGRNVAALRTAEGRWAACHAFLDLASHSRPEALRRLQKIRKRGRRGYLGECADALVKTTLPT